MNITTTSVTVFKIYSSHPFIDEDVEPARCRKVFVFFFLENGSVVPVTLSVAGGT